MIVLLLRLLICTTTKNYTTLHQDFLSITGRCCQISELLIKINKSFIYTYINTYNLSNYHALMYLLQIYNNILTSFTLSFQIHKNSTPVTWIAEPCPERERFDSRILKSGTSQ